jgi:hypothetical protein
MAAWRSTQPTTASKNAQSNATPTTQAVLPPTLPLFTLPREVLYTLGEHCQPNDLFNLSLTCKYALHTLGAYAWPRARESPEYASSEWEFLKTLHKDLPGLEKCYACKKLHRRFACDSPRDGDKSLTCYKGGPEALYFGYTLHFGHVQSVMDRHFLGAKFGVDPSTLAVSTPWRKVNYLFGKPDTRAAEDTVRDYIDVSTPYFRKLDMTPLIVEDELVMATTQRYWIHASEAKTLTPDEDCIPFRMEVCSHQCGHRQCDDDEDRNELQKSMVSTLEKVAKNAMEQPADAASSTFTTYSGIQYCKECPTEFRVSAKWDMHRGIEIAVQSWQVLGNGRDITERGWNECYGKRESFEIPDKAEEPAVLPQNRRLEGSVWEFWGRASLRELFGEDDAGEAHESERDVLAMWEEVDAKIGS